MPELLPQQRKKDADTARVILESLLSHDLLTISENTINPDVLKCAQALVCHKLG